jgi:L-lactate dehydrogenase complex protein LldE
MLEGHVWGDISSSDMAAPRRPTLGTAVRLFATCIVEHVRPSAGLAAIRVLERLGLRVDVPRGLTCCGQPAFNSGAREDARAMARHTLDVLGASDAPVVVPSGSCADMLVHQYPALLEDDAAYAPKASALAGRTFEFSQAVASLDPVMSPATTSGPVAYHPSCHLLRGLGIRDEPQRLLDATVGARRVDLPDAEDCCGFGGLFSVKMSAISSAMLGRKLDNVSACGARTLVSCDSSCLLHLEGGLHRRGASTAVRHLAEVLDACPDLGRERSPGGRHEP